MDREQDTSELTEDLHQEEHSLLIIRYNTIHGKTPHCSAAVWLWGNAALMNCRYDTICGKTPRSWDGGTTVHTGKHRTDGLSYDKGTTRQCRWRYDNAYRKTPHSCSSFFGASLTGQILTSRGISSQRECFDILAVYGVSDCMETYRIFTRMYSLLYVFEWNLFRHVIRRAQNQAIWETGTEENLLHRLKK
jgi:hypothetical protein